MTSNGGQGFLDLVNHFVENYKRSLTDPRHDVYQPLENEVYEKVYMLDRSENAPPLPKGIRAFQVYLPNILLFGSLWFCV